MDNRKSKTFCILPWIHSYVNSNGAYQVCCTADEYHKGIPDKDGVDYNINNRPDVSEVMNSDFMKTLRKQMLEGKWSDVCTRCFETESLDGVSRRIIENKEHENLIDDLIDKTKHDGEIEVELKTLDYRLGNLCNLQCRMCGPFSSGNWIKDWNDVMPEKVHMSPEQVSYYQNFQWVEKDLLIDELKEKINGIDRIHFAGGEPLLSPQMAKILRECIRLGVSKNISISYNTNATVLPKEILNLWKEFKEIKLLCSVDGFREVNDYIQENED
jgi:sulfatase maturation enzyme AslB (radical SAM superfamily)